MEGFILKDTPPSTNDTGSGGKDEKERRKQMSEVSKLIKQIGMQRLLQDMIDELDHDEEYKDDERLVELGYIDQLKADLETALKNYKERYENEE
jgi:hypothetical protein